MRPGKDIREMRTDLLPWYFQNLDIKGFEDKEESEEHEEEEESEEGDEKEDKGTGSDGLKSALRKERAERRRLEKENKALAKSQKDRDDADKTDTAKASEKATAAEAKAQKLADRLKDAALENSIIKLATKMDFLDVDDAITLVDRAMIEMEQDEDDPSDIEVDEASVKAALDALKKKKPHLFKSSTEDKKEEKKLPKSGSKFAGGDKSKEQLDEEALYEKYPALRRSARKS